MSLSAGDKLGPYEILASIGAGGMGEVYRARDPRLGRDVAIKVSAERFNERFEREARVIASLNHPNICHLYDVGPNYLVMELVEGEAPQGPLPFDTAMNYARQIAAALEEAHEKGVTHRDLKPGNIKIKPDGTVKVLDFGLAKIGSTPTAPSENSPTLSMAATQVGMILGTAGYMSPEQARGRPVDKRADIWAFGVVLYELLTGKRLFQGEDVTETLAAVVMKEPDLSAAPAQVHRLLQKCLEKDPKKRLRDMGDAWELLEEAPPVVAQATAAKLPWFAAAFCAALAAVLAFLYFRQPPRPTDPLRRLELALPIDASFQPELSPDGRILTFSALSNGKPAIWVRSLDSASAPRLLQGTVGNTGLWFFSPDSRFIAFTKDGELKKIDVAGGPPTTIAKSDYTVQARGGSWNRDDVLIFGSPWGIVRVALADGKTSLLTEIVPDKELDHIVPFFLPDGRHFVYIRSGLRTDAATLFTGALDAAPQQQPTQPLGATQGGGPSNHLYYFAARNPQTAAVGILLFRRDNTLMAQPFDPNTLRLSGNASPVSEGSVASFTASPGLIVYRTGTPGSLRPQSQLTWYDSSGKSIGKLGEIAVQGGLRISPDGTQVAVEKSDPDLPVVSILSSARGTAARLSAGGTLAVSPVWSPDGAKIAFATLAGGIGSLSKGKRTSASLGDLYTKAADGAGPETILFKEGGFPLDWSRDGVILLSRLDLSRGTPIPGLFALRMKDGKADGEVTPYLVTPASLNDGVFSPDSHWVAYESDESGKSEIYVSSFPDASRSRTIISAGGGRLPRWSRNGRELFYISADNALMAVPVTGGASFQAGKPKALFTAPGRVLGWDVAQEGRFLLNVAAANPATSTPGGSSVIVVSNWQTALRQ